MFKKQELGETVDAMMQNDVKDIEDILNANPKGVVYILIHHKPTQSHLKSGEQILVKVVKVYKQKPPPLLGTMILTVKDGEIINEEVNLHDMPINWEAVAPHLGSAEDPFVQKRSDIAGAYVYN